MSATMPALFVGHGSPMNALEDNTFTRGWQEAAQRIGLPKAILCISAHWETRGVHVSAAEHPETIHDFYGFPQTLFDVRYPAPGAPALARRIARMIKSANVYTDPDHGLDHGTWSVLRVMYPDAAVPTLQLSLDTTQPGGFHYRLAQELGALRDDGVLILGSDVIRGIAGPEHFLPLLYVLAQQQAGEPLRFFNDAVISSISMTCVQVG